MRALVVGRRHRYTPSNSHGALWETPMAAILPILIFVLAIMAINLFEFHRVD
jgi:hypothetical protein